MTMMNKIRKIIWDWNGTLVDDLSISLATLNEALLMAGNHPIGEKYYRENFDFPVRDFYKNVGLSFSDKDFDRYSAQFMDSYFRKIPQVTLHNGVTDMLFMLKQKGIRQFILSAMEQSLLEKMVRDFGIYDYFENIQGLENLHAHSKTDAGRVLLEKNGGPTNTLMIGDTRHDFEVAEKLGIECCLLSCGHHTIERLEKTGAPVFSGHKELLKHLEQNQRL